MKKIQLNNNVQLITQPTSQFKTIIFQINFIKKLSDDLFVAQKQVSVRALLSSMMETVSQKYPDLQQLNTKLAEMYGADFDAEVLRLSTVDLIQFNLEVVSDKLIDHSQLDEVLDFLNQQILHPKLDDKDQFEIEKNNLLNYLDSQEENKANYARRKLEETYFNNKVLAVNPNGVRDIVAGLNLADLENEYNRLMEEDPVIISVVGDIDEKEVIQKISSTDLKFSNRKESKKINFFTHQPLHKDMDQLNEKQELSQAKLMLGYQLEIDQNNNQRYAAIIMNQIFGGSVMSKLFMNLREKESLAYSINSIYDRFAGLLTVAAGIDKQNYQKTKQLIEVQLTQIQDGDFDDKLLQQIKDSLISERKVYNDNLSNIVRRVLYSELLNIPLDDQIYNIGIQSVTKSEIINLAKQVTLQAEFFLTYD